MPNGGVPRHMILRPRAGPDYVLHCDGGTMAVYARTDWDAQRASATPLFRLSSAEGASLAWFLRYWIGEQRLRPGYSMRHEVDAEFDF